MTWGQPTKIAPPLERSRRLLLRALTFSRSNAIKDLLCRIQRQKAAFGT